MVGTPPSTQGSGLVLSAQVCKLQICTWQFPMGNSHTGVQVSEMPMRQTHIWVLSTAGPIHRTATPSALCKDLRAPEGKLHLFIFQCWTGSPLCSQLLQRMKDNQKAHAEQNALLMLFSISARPAVVTELLREHRDVLWHIITPRAGERRSESPFRIHPHHVEQDCEQILVFKCYFYINPLTAM